MGDPDPGLGAGDGSLEVLGEPSAPAEPGEGALDDPTPGQQDEALGGIRSFDDLDGPPSQFGERRRQFVAGISPVSEQVAQPGIQRPNRGQNGRCPAPILDVGRMDIEPEEVPTRLTIHPSSVHPKRLPDGRCTALVAAPVERISRKFVYILSGIGMGVMAQVGLTFVLFLSIVSWKSIY